MGRVETETRSLKERERKETRKGRADLERKGSLKIDTTEPISRLLPTKAPPAR